MWFIESNSLQADIGKIHITALKLLVPVGEVILTSNCQSTRQLYMSVIKLFQRSHK